MLPQISVVVGTFNRAESLHHLLESALAQVTDIPFEIVVADNGSTDRTADVAAAFASAGHPVRYVRDNSRGVSHARNTGAASAAASILAFTDDDQHLAPGWIQTIADVLGEYQEIDALGGRVLPQWDHPRPLWLSPNLMGPVSLFDRGDRRIRLNRNQWMCLPGGNLAIRRGAFVALGGFNPAYPRSQDRELTVRLLLSGREAMYVPSMVVYHHLDAARLTKGSFRRWSVSEGRMRAGYAFEELFTRDGEIRPLPANLPRLLGVSRFMYRRLAQALAAYGAALLVRPGEAFRHEMHVLYLAAYVKRRQELARHRTRQSDDPIRRLGATAVRRMLASISQMLG